MSGPAARLVHPDPSASDNGDHPFCLVFHTANDEALLALGAVAANHLGVGGGGGGGAGVEDGIVSCEVVRKAELPGSRAGAAAAGRGRAVGARSGRSGTKSGGRGNCYVRCPLDLHALGSWLGISCLVLGLGKREMCF